MQWEASINKESSYLRVFFDTFKMNLGVSVQVITKERKSYR